MKNIASVFEVTDMKTKDSYRETIYGDGQLAIRNLRKMYPFFTKFVLVGFEISEKFIKLRTRR